MRKNINSRAYWDEKFISNDWGPAGGNQTRSLAQSYIQYVNLPTNFSGTLLDFGCGTGDACLEFREKWPKAELIGIDFSKQAVIAAKEKFAGISDFRQDTHEFKGRYDVIIASNVIEHIENDTEVVEILKSKSDRLFVIVPFEEELPLSAEHLRQYSRNSFDSLEPVSKKVFLAKGWSYFGIHLISGVYVKNLLRKLRGEPTKKQRFQIMFEFCD